MKQVIEYLKKLVALTLSGVEVGVMVTNSEIEHIARAIADLHAAVDLSKHECEWVTVGCGVEDGDTLERTACGEEQIIGEPSPELIGFKFCPYCGGEIKEIT